MINVALIAGGFSGESVISLQTAKTIQSHLDAHQFNVYKIILTTDRWYYEGADGTSVDIDKNDFTITLNGHKVIFDIAFIAIHGTPGEDGKLQGYLDMLGIKYTSCDAIVSALTFNKFFCNKVVKSSGIVQIANSIVLYKNDPYSLGSLLSDLKLPVFVKPNAGGSSIATSKVTKVEELIPAIELAFTADNEVIIEEFIKGRELTIGVYKSDKQIEALPPTEIISSKEFFDYEAKYTPGVTSEVTPADISEAVLDQLVFKAKSLYKLLHCKGAVRMDFILNETNDEFYFLEVNTMPGQSENSILPQQIVKAGLSLKEFYANLITQALNA
jgi:D-alanine-D-alanine ligase